MKKRLLALLLAVVMLFGMIPMAAASENGVHSINPGTTKTATYEFYVGESKKDTQIVKNGELLTEPAAPSGTGRFLGWYIEGETSPIDFTQPVSVSGTKTAPIRVVAKFDNVKYLLFMDKQGTDGRVVACKAIQVDGSVTTSDMNSLVQVDADQGVTGWKDSDGRLVTVVRYTDNITVLYAVISAGYWLTFDSSGGSYIQPQFFTTTPTAPADPTKPGYFFAGWMLADGTDVNIATITTTTTVYAKWTAERSVKYTVLHMLENADDDGYSTADVETLSGAAGELTNAKAKTTGRYNKVYYEGFTAQPITQQTIKGDGSTIVYVYYKRNVYEVKFYTQSGRNWTENTSLRITAKYGANISDKWPGGGWYVSTSGTTAQSNIDVMPLGGANFYGQQDGYYTFKAYYYVEVLPGEKGDVTKGNVSYKLDHTDTANSNGRLTVTQEDKYPITGFTCNESISTRNGASYNNAKFYYTRNAYDIIFMNPGEEKTLEFKFEQDISGAGYTPTAPAGYEGYVFGGWYDNEACEGVAFAFTGKTMPAQSITLYAKWVKPVFTVIFMQGNTELKRIANIQLGDKITAADAPTNLTLAEGEEFCGWTLANGTPFSFDTEIRQNYTLYANIGSKAGYTLTYVVEEGGKAPTDPKRYAKDANAVVLNYDTYTGTDDVFLGWTTTVNGTAVDYVPGSTIQMTGNKTLYAVFGPKTAAVTLTYHSNFGEPEETETYSDILPNNGSVAVKDYPETGMTGRTGYEFQGWSTTKDGLVEYAAGETVIIDNIDAGTTNHLYAVWEASRYALRIQYFYKGAGKAAEDYTDMLAYGEAYSVDSPEIPGYTADKPTVSGTMPGYAVTAIVTYTKRSDLSYTVKYCWNNTDPEQEIAPEKTVNGQIFDEIAKESPIAIDGYTPIDDGEQEVRITTGENVITFYYYKNVTLTANSATKTYDGTEQTVTGYTSSEEAASFAGITASGRGTTVGTYSVTFNEGALNTVDSTEKYIVKTLNDGELIITPIADEITVTITGNSDTKVYNGSEQSVTGFTTDVDEKPITVTLKEGHKAEAKGTNVGDYTMGLTAGDFTVTSDIYSNIKVVVNDGKLTITPITDETIVTITGNSATKTYNGTEQSVTGYTTDVGSKSIDVALKEDSKAEAKGTNVGEYKMDLTADDFNVTSANYSNIKVVVVDGWLTITPITDEVTVTITGNHDTVKYDGTEKTVTGYTTDVGSKSITVELKRGHKAEAKGTKVGEYKMNLTAADFNVTSANYSNIKVVVVDGWLKIVNRAIRVDPDDIYGKPVAQKTLVVESGKAPTETFEVVIKTLNGTVMSTGTATLTKSGTVSFTGFEDLVFTEKGTYYFTIGETDNNTHGMRYDSSLYTLCIQITEERDGSLSLGAVYYTNGSGSKYSFPITFTNTYRATPIIIPTTPSKLNTDDHFAYIIGYPDGTVRPNGEITRAEVATIFFRLLTDDVRRTSFTTYNAYTDVSADKWYNNPISTMSRLGIIKGYPDGTFRPNAPITRAEFAAIAARFDEHKAAKLASFTDIYGHWAVNEISLAYENGWIKGYSDGTFRPNRNITRAEAMTLINRVLNRAPEKPSDLLNDMNKWTDNMDTTKWYYLAVQEATNSHDYTRKANNYEMWKKMLIDPDWSKYER